MNPAIRKVFFDGKKDLEALHYLMGFGVQNFVDVQVGHMAYTQLKEFQKNKKSLDGPENPTQMDFPSLLLQGDDKDKNILLLLLLKILLHKPPSPRPTPVEISILCFDALGSRTASCHDD